MCAFLSTKVCVQIIFPPVYQHRSLIWFTKKPPEKPPETAILALLVFGREEKQSIREVDSGGGIMAWLEIVFFFSFYLREVSVPFVTSQLPYSKNSVFKGQTEKKRKIMSFSHFLGVFIDVHSLFLESKNNSRIMHNMLMMLFFLTDKASQWQHSLLDPGWDSKWDQSFRPQHQTETVAHEWGVLKCKMYFFHTS